MSNSNKASAPQRLDAFQKSQEQRVNLAGVLASTFLQSASAIDDAKASLASASEGQLSLIRKALGGSDPITAQEWDNDIAAPLYEALKASGRYSLDAKGHAPGARPVVSNLKPVAVAVTHGCTLGVATTVAAAATVAREFNAKQGLIAISAKGAPKGSKAKAPVAGISGASVPKAPDLTPLQLVHGACADLAGVMGLNPADAKAFETLLTPIVTTVEGQAAFFAFLKEAGTPSPNRKSVFDA